MRYRSWLALFMLILMPIISYATPSRPLSVAEHNRLVPARICLDNVSSLRHDVLTTPAQFDAAVAVCLTQAKKELGRDISFVELAQNVKTSPELTGMQRAAGWLDGVSWMRVLFAVGIAVFGSIFVAVTLPLWLSLPKTLYEAGFYAAAFGLSGYGLSLNADNGIWGFLGTLIFIGALWFTTYWRKLSGSPSRFFLIILVYAAVSAFLFQSTLIGYVAVLALMCAAGFAAEAFGMGFAIGFSDDRSVSIGTMVAFATLGLYVMMRVVGIDQPYIQVFAPGAFFIGSFVGFLGLLIMSSKWYAGGGGYLAMNIAVMPAMGIAAIMIGSTFAIPELQKIGGTFFVLWGIEKYVEWTFRGLSSISFFGLTGSVGGYMLMNYAVAHASVVGPYLYFIS